MSKANLIRVVAGLLLISIIAYVFTYYRQDFSITRLYAQIQAYGIWAPIVFMLLYIIAVVCFLPGSVLTITGGLLFGPWLGTVYNLSAATVGASLAFLMSRYLAHDWVAQKTGGKLKTLIDGVAKEGWKFVAVTRLVPLFPFNLLNYALGLTPVKFIQYFFATLIFMLPGAFAYTYLGSLGFAAIHGKPRELIGRAFVALGLLVIVGLIPWAVKKWRKP